MTNNQGYLVFDVGTGNARVAVISKDGVVKSIKREDVLYSIEPLYPDSHYFAPDKLWSQLLNLAKAALAEAKEIEIIAITSTSQRQGIVLLNEQGESIIGLPNLDNRGREWESEIADHDKIYSKSGRLPNTLFSGLKLYAVKQKQQELWKQVSKFTSISDWITYKCTNVLTYEPSQAAETLLFDVNENNWSEELCSYLEIESNILPPIVWAGTKLGTLIPSLAEVLQLPTTIPVIVGGGDTQLAVRSTDAEHDDFVIVSGTTTPIVKLVKEVVTDVEGRTWLNSHIEKNTWLAETNPGITGLNYQRLKTIFYPNESYDVIEKEISEMKDFSITASLGSYLTHEKNALVKGGFIFNAPISQDLSRAHFIFSALREIACTVKLHFDTLTTVTEAKKDYVWACGGGVQSLTLIQLLADLLQKEIRIVEGFEFASISGAAKICNKTLEVKNTVTPAITKVEPRSVDASFYHEWLQAQHYFQHITEVSKSQIVTNK